MKASLSPPSALRRVLLTGDQYGIRELLSVVPRERVCGLIAASNRPQYHQDIRKTAEDLDLPMLVQPLRNDVGAFIKFVERVASMAVDGLVCYSYSMLLPKEVLDLVKVQAFNVHASLLPRNRGPNPVQWVLIHGESETGVTLHIMDQGMDTGPIVDQISIAIRDEDTWVTLLQRVNIASRKLLKRVVPKLLKGQWRAIPQDNNMATRNPRIPRESFRIDFARMSDREVFNLIRAQVSPLKGAYLLSEGKKIHIREWISMDDVKRLRKKYYKSC